MIGAGALRQDNRLRAKAKANAAFYKMVPADFPSRQALRSAARLRMRRLPGARARMIPAPGPAPKRLTMKQIMRCKAIRSDRAATLAGGGGRPLGRFLRGAPARKAA